MPSVEIVFGGDVLHYDFWVTMVENGLAEILGRRVPMEREGAYYRLMIKNATLDSGDVERVKDWLTERRYTILSEEEVLPAEILQD